MILHSFQRFTVSIVLALGCACAKEGSPSTETPRPAEALSPAPPSAPPSPPQRRSEPLVTDAHPAQEVVDPTVESDDDGSAEPGSPCVQSRRVVDDDFETPWGSTPREILKTALGRHRAKMTWRPERAFSYDVEGTTTTLRAEITRAGSATFIGRDGTSRCDSQPCMDYDCPSLLLIPVHVAIETQDGAIAVEGDSELTVTSPRYIGVSIGQPFDTHRGSLRIGEIREKGLVLDGFGINLGFSSKGTMVGGIRGNYEIQGVGALWVEYACFPDKPPRELRGAEEIEIGCTD